MVPGILNETMRKTGKEALSTVLSKQRNIDMLEEYAYTFTVPDEHAYRKLIYNIIGMLSVERSTKTVQECMTLIFNRRTAWNHPIYETFAMKQEEEDHFMTAPFEIEEGVLECRKCGSKKTFSFQRQTRSADEGSTTFAQCASCGQKWKHNN